MGVNLDNLHLTLDQFNAAASGKYNIGQLKLSEDGSSVYRTNNHKTWTIFNNTPISPEESLALKTAFCRALASEGLSPDDIASVKEKLGIAGKSVDVIRAGGIKPLSAADVRQIIDEYAGIINTNREIDGTATLKTGEDIYKGVSKKTMEARETKRNEINSRTIDSMVSEADQSVNTILDILQYTGEGETETLSNLQKGIANEISIIMKRPGNLPDKNNPIQLNTALASLHEADDASIVVTFMLDGGNTFSVNTGMEREELLAQMNKAQAGKARGAGKPAGEERVAEDPKDKSGKAVNNGAGKVNQQKITLTASQEALIDDLESAFALLNPNDKQAFNAKVDSAKKTIIKESLEKIEKKAKKALANNPNAGDTRVKTKEEILADKKFQSLMEAKAKDNVRSNVITNIVEPLQKELDKVRGLDNKNVLLVNKVRNALSGDTTINRKELIDEIKLAFITKVVNSIDKVMEEIDSGHQDDLTQNLNINNWLGK